MVAARAWPSCSATFSAMMDAAGIAAEARHRIFVEDPARAFAFATGDPATTD